MHTRGAWHRIYGFLIGLKWCLGVAVATMGIAIKFDRSDSSYGPILSPALSWLHSNAVFLLIFSLFYGFVELVIRGIGPPWIKDHVHNILDQVQAFTLCERSTSELHHHKITLFRHHRWYLCWQGLPWTGWLVPVIRSGHGGQK